MVNGSQTFNIVEFRPQGRGFESPHYLSTSPHGSSKLAAISLLANDVHGYFANDGNK